MILQIDVGVINLKWMRMVGLGEVSPLGALVAGTLIGVVGLPTIKKGVRGVAVSAVGAAMAVTDFVKNSTGNISREWHEVLEDARVKKVEGGHAVKEHLHDAAVDLAGAGLAVTEMARDRVHDIKEGFENKVAQTREELAEIKKDLIKESPFVADKAGKKKDTGNIGDDL